MTFMSRMKDFIVNLLWRRAPVVEIGSAIKLGPRLTPRLRSSIDPSVERWGRFYFKDAILDQIENYFSVAARMKKADPVGYEIYARVGANILPSAAVAEVRGLSALWRAGKRPGFGAIALYHPKGRDYEPTDERVSASFMYFQKVDKPNCDVQPFAGSCYQLVAYFDPKGSKYPTGVAFGFHVGIDGSGHASLLKRRQFTTTRVRSKKHPGRTFTIPRYGWGFDPAVISWWRDNKHVQDAPFEEWALGCFYLVANFYEGSETGARVRVAKRGLVAAFCLDVERTPYFFADRQVVDGQKKKIFHAVRAHERVAKSGKTSRVRVHFRGQRSFQWNGYDVNITIPGLQHNPLIDFDGAAVVTDDLATPKGMLEMPDFARRVDRHLHV